MSTNTNDNKYSRALELTTNLLGTPPDNQLYGRGAKWRWAALARLWETATDRLDCNVFYAALHHIFWGIHPNSITDPVLLELLTLIEEELLSDGNAYRAWKPLLIYRLAFEHFISLSCRSDRPRGPRLHSRIADQYLCCRLYYRVVYKEHEPRNINLATANRREIVSAQSHAKARSFVLGYEYIVNRLVPEAANWSYAQWSDDRVLFRSLKKHYGVNLINSPSTFTSIITYLINEWVYDTGCTLGHVVNIKDMPLPIAQSIWPNDTVNQVAKMFLAAYRRGKSVEHREHLNYRGEVVKRKTTFSFANLKESWLYRQTLAWVYDGTLSGPPFKAVRQAAMELGMEI